MDTSTPPQAIYQVSQGVGSPNAAPTPSGGATPGDTVIERLLRLKREVERRNRVRPPALDGLDPRRFVYVRHLVATGRIVPEKGA